MHVYPPPPTEQTCVLLFVPVELVPIVGALFGRLERRAEWASHSDWLQGYKAFVELQEQLMANCLQDLVNEVRALRGVKPEYEDVPLEERTIDMYRSLNDLLDGLLLLRGLVTGEDYGTLAELVLALRGTEAPTDHILLALRGETDATEIRNVVGLLE